MNEYWVVTNTRTGKIIANCGDINDAVMMVSFDPNNRSYNRQRFILDQVIDVTSTVDKQLPGQMGLPPGTYKIEDCKIYKLEEGEGQPIVI